MTISGNCPNCGSTLPPGVTVCARCGHTLPEPAPLEAPPAGPAIEKPSTRTVQSIDVAKIFAETRERWRVEKSTLFIAALAMAVLAFLISTIAGPSLIAADDSAFDTRSDSAVWLQLAFGLAVGAAALSVLIRWESGPPRESDETRIDFRVAAGLAGVTLFLALLGLIKGFDGSALGADAWFRFAIVYAAVAVAILAISRPVPLEINGTASRLIGVITVATAVGALIIGQFTALSNDSGTHAMGIGFQGSGIVLMILALGWFLGLQNRRAT